MADNLQASPQSPGLAALARLLSGTHEFASRPFGYENPPARMLSEMLGIPATARTVERMSYGEPLTTGRGMTTRMRPDTEEALMAVAPLSQYVARVPRAAQYAVTQAAKDFAHASAAGVPHVVKPKGGNWLSGSVENALEPMKSTVRDPEFMRRIAQDEVRGLAQEGMLESVSKQNDRAEAINKWLETKLAKYIKNEMGTPEDPIRLLAERGVTHSEVAPVDTYGVAELAGRRKAAGFPAEGMGKSEQARAWEAAADDIIHNMPAGERINVNTFGEDAALRNLKENPWLQKVPPETMTYGTYPLGFEGQTQFGHMIDELRNAVNPESGLPANLRWKYADLDKVNMEQAVQRVHDINQWRAAQQAEANAMRANNAAAALHKDYPDAPYKWVELKAPELNELQEGYSVKPMDKEGWFAVHAPDGRSTGAIGKSPEEAIANQQFGRQALEDALKYEGETMGHCVGGYCPDVMSGKSRIFSLRNKKTGEPHVTIETSPERYQDFTSRIPDPDNPNQTLRDRINAARQGNGDFEEVAARTLRELGLEPTQKIVQIKGKANLAPKEQYLPYVQDFVRSGKWSKVGDLRNTGLMETEGFKHGGMDPQIYEAVRAELGDYATMDDIVNAAERLSAKPAEGHAHGGLVGHTEYEPLHVDHLVDELRNYAQGGVITQQVKAPFNEFSMNYDINPVEIGHAEGGLVEDKKSDVPDLEFQDPESLRLYKHAMKMGVGPTEVNTFGTGVSAGNLNVGFDTARVNPESSDRLMNSLMANYGVKLGDVGINANLRKPLEAEGVYLGMLNGTVPVGQGMAMLGVQGVKTPYGKEVTGYNAGWSGKAGPGRLNVNVMQPKGHPSNRSAQVMYQVPFAEGGSVESTHLPYDEAKISSLVNALYEDSHG